MIRRLLIAALLALPLPLRAQDILPPVAGEFTLDPAHTRLIFRVNHLGFSNYTAFFTNVTAQMQFDPNHPEAMAITATVRTDSLETLFPDPAFDFNAELTGKDYLDATSFPEITFTSTAVQPTGDATADVSGDFTLHGVTKPLTLAVTYNGGWADFPMDAGARIGFSATGSILRSDFGISAGIPSPGTTLGVSDRVEIILEAEFIKPRA